VNAKTFRSSLGFLKKRDMVSFLEGLLLAQAAFKKWNVNYPAVHFFEQNDLTWY
jgi:hypothetical protein